MPALFLGGFGVCDDDTVCRQRDESPWVYFRLGLSGGIDLTVMAASAAGPSNGVCALLTRSWAVATVIDPGRHQPQTSRRPSQPGHRPAEPCCASTPALIQWTHVKNVILPSTARRPGDSITADLVRPRKRATRVGSSSGDVFLPVWCPLPACWVPRLLPLVMSCQRWPVFSFAMCSWPVAQPEQLHLLLAS